MLIYGPAAAAAFCVKTSLYCVNCNNNKISSKSSNLTRFGRRCILAGSFLAAAAVLVPAALPAEVPQNLETLSNIPQTLSGECSSAKDCKKPRIQRPKSRKAELCTIKCVTTCITGGDRSLGEGPFNIRGYDLWWFLRKGFGVEITGQQRQRIFLQSLDDEANKEDAGKNPCDL
ncbi:hypothetical protein GQ457_03G042760 [Hibiscus cannabinus]